MEKKERHARVIGKILLVLGILTLVLTSFSFNFVHFAEGLLIDHFDDWSFDIGIFTLNYPPFGLLYIIPIFYMSIAIIKIGVGLGLLAQKRWARIVALFLSLFLLFHFPLGTALGVYIIYALLDDKTVGQISMDKGQPKAEGSATEPL